MRATGRMRGIAILLRSNRREQIHPRGTGLVRIRTGLLAGPGLGDRALEDERSGTPTGHGERFYTNPNGTSQMGHRKAVQGGNEPTGLHRTPRLALAEHDTRGDLP